MTVDDAGVAQVRLARADKRNALDLAMFRAIAAAGEELKSTPGLRAVVLSGEGASFCAGLDFGAVRTDGGRRHRYGRRPTGSASATSRRAASPISASRCAGCGRRSRCR